MLGVRSLLYPPALIKTRIQVQEKRELYKGTFDALLKIRRAEGFRGLYKGFLTLSVGFFPINLVYITSFEYVRACMQRFLPSQNTAPIRDFVGGASASVIASSLSVPLENVTKLLMIQDGTVNKTKYSGGMHVLKSILNNEGIKGLYRGYVVSLSTNAFSSGVWWSTYSVIKKNLMELVDNYVPSAHRIDLLVYATCGSLSGIVAAVIANPIDVIRARFQVLSLASVPAVEGKGGMQSFPIKSSIRPKRGAIAVFWEIMKQEGLWGFTRGITARMVTMSSSSFLLMLSYEAVKQLSRKTE